MRHETWIRYLAARRGTEHYHAQNSCSRRVVPGRPRLVGVGRESGSRSPHRPEGRRPAQGPAGGRRRHLPQRREDHRRRAQRQYPAPRHRPGRRRRGQHRHPGRHAAGHRGHEHPRRQHHFHRRTHDRPDAGHVAEHRPRLPKPDRGPLGPQEVHGHATGRQDAGHHRAGTGRPGRGHAGPRPRNADPRLRSLPAQRQGEGTGHRNVRVGQGHAPPGRLPHRPHAAERGHEEPHRRRRRCRC